MTFPTVVAVTGGNSTSDITNPTLNLPDGSNVSGRLILMHFCSDGTGETLSLPAGWTKIATDGGTGLTNAIFYRVTDGTEGYPATGATIQGTITSVEQSAHTSILLSGFHTTTAPAVSTAATGASTAPDSGSLNPSGWDVEDTLWFSFCACNGLSSTTPRVTGYPSGYSGTRSDISAGGNGVVLGMAYKESAAASEDPGAYTIGTSADWRAFTVAVRPAAAAAATLFRRTLADRAGSRS